MEQSILKSTKKILGLADDYTAFDSDVITHINTAFSTVNQLGVGPTGGFTIEDNADVWDDIGLPQNQENMIKTYIFLKVKMLFDPPTTSFTIDAMNDQLKELEWRLSTFREGLVPVTTTTTTIDPIDGTTTTVTEEEVVTW